MSLAAASSPSKKQSAIEYTRSLCASNNRRNASESPRLHASIVRSSMICFVIRATCPLDERPGPLLPFFSLLSIFPSPADFRGKHKDDAGVVEPQEEKDQAAQRAVDGRRGLRILQIDSEHPLRDLEQKRGCA